MIQFSFVQNFLAQKASSYLSEKLGNEISVGKVKITRFKNISVANLYISDQRGDTLLYSGLIEMKLKHRPFRRQGFEILDATIENTGLFLKTYPGDSVPNLRFFLDYFAGSDTASEASPLSVICHSLTGSNLEFRLSDMNAPPVEAGLDYKHLSISHIFMEVTSFVLQPDSISARIETLSAEEQSGLEIRHFSSDALLAPGLISAKALFLETNRSNLDMDLSFTYSDFAAFALFIDSVKMRADIRNSTFNLADIGYFAPGLFEMDNRLAISGQLSGTVSNIRAKNLQVNYLNSTSFTGQVSITGLPDIEETFFNVSVEDMITKAADIRNFRLPGKNNTISLPEQVALAGPIRIKGKFTGFYYDFVSFASFRSEIGSVSTDITLKLVENKTFKYKGSLSATQLDGGKLISNPELLGKMDFSLHVSGSGLTPETADLVLNGKISSIELFGHMFNSILLTGNFKDKAFNGNLLVSDEAGDLDFTGKIDLGNTIPKYNFIASIKDFTPSAIQQLHADSTLRISTNLDINLIGTKFDEMQGIVKIDSSFGEYLGDQYFMKNLTFSMTGDSDDYRILTLFSDYVDASLEGSISFGGLWPSLLQTADIYLDTLITAYDTLAAKALQDFRFDINLKNTESLSGLLLPGSGMAGQSIINGTYNSQNNDAKVTVASDKLEFKGTVFEGIKLDVGTYPARSKLTFSSNRIFFSDTLHLDSLRLTSFVDNDSILFSSKWYNPYLTKKRTGEISGLIDFVNYHRYKIRLSKANVVIGGKSWNMGKENMIVIDTSSLAISNFVFGSDTEKITLNGSLSHNHLDTLHAVLSNFNLSNLDFLLRNLQLDFKGTVDGSVSISDIYNSPNLISDIVIHNLHFNGEKLGDGMIVTSWNEELSALKVNADIIYTGNIGQRKVLGVNGWYMPMDKANNFDMDIELDNYKLNTLQPFLSSFASGIDGQASGKVRMTGKTSEPHFAGEISLIHARMKVDFLNVTYYFADRIVIEKDKIFFNNMVIYDSLNNRGTVTGTIDFNGFRDLALDFTIKTENLASLNTTSAMSSIFYGRAHSTGDIIIKGPVNDLSINIVASSGKGTDVVIPISSSVGLTHDYIVFVDRSASAEQDEQGLKRDFSGLKMDFDLNVTPDAEIEIILPYRIGKIRGQGAGNIRMDIDPAGNFTMNGTYEIRKGSLFLTLQNIVNRHFEITRGSKIWWTGDPYDANINLRAVYRVKTTLGGFAPEGDSATRVPVDGIIQLKNKLLDPEFRFTVEFPGLSDDARQYIYARLDTNDQAEMNQQMVSLLVLNSFSMGAGTSSGVGFNTFSLLSNQINNWLSRISKDVDIGINYRPGDNISQHEVELALSTQLFDDRLTIDGNVGVKGDQPGHTNQNANNIVGEVVVELRITPDGRFRVKAFNKANNSYLYKNYAPYTQGLGIFYTQEFNKLSDLKKPKKALLRQEKKKK